MAVTRVHIYNQIINLFWTAVCFAPLVRLWYLHYVPAILISTLAVCLLPIFIPGKHFGAMQLSRRRKFYESLLIKSFQSFTQDGRLVSALTNKRNKHYRLVRQRATHGAYKTQIAMYEKFHWSCLVFFLVSFAYAIYQQAFLVSFLILISNVVYNVIPILIQQYNKLRLGLA